VKFNCLSDRKNASSSPPQFQTPHDETGALAASAPRIVMLIAADKSHPEPGNRQRPPAKAHQTGFTLLEMLVVIVLTGMIATFLFEGLNQVYRLQTHFDAELDHSRKDAMIIDWARQAIIGLQPDYEDGEDKFSGDEKHLQGLTTNPIDASLAVAAFRMELEYDPKDHQTHLNYLTGEKTTRLLSWPGKKGRFVFLDPQQQEHDTWPPRMVKKPQQIPAAIRLEAQRNDQPWTLVVSPMSPGKPRVRIEDIFGQ
jgi:prepilin-type N-terminal cleavage/methylation domain-containing protein